MQPRCLLLVERGVSEPDMVKSMLGNALGDYFRGIRPDVGPSELERWRATERSSLADYGLATQISLTSVVLVTELEAAGIGVVVLDDDDLHGQYADWLRKNLGEFDVVAVSTTYTVQTQTVARLLKLIREINADVPVLLGGQGLSAWSLHGGGIEWLAAQLPGADAWFFGEAEGVFGELISRMARRASLEGLPNTVYRSNGGYVGTTESRSVEVNAVAIPDWSTLHRHDFNDSQIKRQGLPSVASIEEGRGCSFRCKFCSFPLYSSFRRKTPERVVGELKNILDAGFPTAAFTGAEFLNPLHQSRPVFEGIAAAKLPIDLWAYARLDLVSYNPWIADLMHAARFKFIQFGMESGDRGLLRAMGKNYDVDKMTAGSRLLRERGIDVYASLIIGYPGETPDTLKRTQEVLVDCDFAHVIIHVLQPVPGTRLWHEREQYALKVNEFGLWSHQTMRVVDVPPHVKAMFLTVHDRTHSHINNVTQNFANQFLNKRRATADLFAASRALQDVVANEWRQQPREARQRARVELWPKVAQVIEQVPPELLDPKPKPAAAARSPQGEVAPTAS